MLATIFILVSVLCIALVTSKPEAAKEAVLYFSKSGVSQPATVSGYRIDAYFSDQPVCRSDEPLATWGTAFGVCQWSMSKGVVVSSSRSVITGMNSSALFYTTEYHGAPFDCTGPVTSSHNSTSYLGCKQYGATSELFKYIDAAVDQEPWKAYTKGVIEK